MLDKNKFTFPKYNPENLFMLWETVGFCLLQLQVFERTIESYLIIVHKLDIKMAREEIEKIYDKYSKYTLGKLFKEIRETVELPKDLDSRVDHFVNERNWLVHRCRKENEKDFYIKERLNKIIGRINSLHQESVKLGDYFSNKSDEYIIKQGIMSEEKLIVKTQEILDSWGAI